MAKNKVSEWSSTASNNTDVGGIDISEGCAPSGINNALRTIMAEIKDMQSGTSGDSFSVGGTLSVTGASTLSGGATVTGNMSVSGKITTDLVGDVYSSNGTSKVLEAGTDGTNATFTGNVTGNLTGNVNTFAVGSNSVGARTIQPTSTGVPSAGTGNNGDIIYQY